MRDIPRSVMLFAAGFGTRMGALTADRPKPMIEVAGRPLIDHALDLVRDFGAETVVVNLHYKPQMIERHLAGRGVRFSCEQPEILETGGGLRAALPLLGPGPVFTMNTDVIWSGPNPFKVLAGLWQPDRMDGLLLCVPPEQAKGHSGTGDFVITEDGRAKRGPGLIYSGVQILKPGGLAEIQYQSFSLNILWDRMMRRNRLFAAPYPGYWCDVGSPEGISAAEDMLEQGHV